MTQNTADIESIHQGTNPHITILVDKIERAINEASDDCNLSEIVGALEICKQVTINNSVYSE